MRRVFLRKDLGVDLQLLSNQEKTLLVDALKYLYQLPDLLAQLGLARSSYFYHRARMRMTEPRQFFRRLELLCTSPKIGPPGIKIPGSQRDD